MSQKKQNDGGLPVGGKREPARPEERAGRPDRDNRGNRVQESD